MWCTSLFGSSLMDACMPAEYVYVGMQMCMYVCIRVPASVNCTTLLPIWGSPKMNRTTPQGNQPTTDLDDYPSDDRDNRDAERGNIFAPCADEHLRTIVYPAATHFGMKIVTSSRSRSSLSHEVDRPRRSRSSSMRQPRWNRAISQGRARIAPETTFLIAVLSTRPENKNL